MATAAAVRGTGVGSSLLAAAVAHVAATGTRESAQRLSQVSTQVLGGLDPDREPHQPRVDGQR
jgi:hypothetical protein